MKKITYLFVAAVLGMPFTSCNQDHEPDWSETAPFGVNATSISIADGATVALDLNTIEIVYDHDIAVNALTQITLNGNQLTDITVDGVTLPAVEVNGNKLTAHFTLSKGKNYVFNIPARAIAGIGSKTFAPEINVNFHTERGNVLDKSLAATSLTNPNATAEAKAVYKLLLDNYGEKQFSGVMGEVAWGSQFYDLVTESAGKAPAIIGFDYIHLGWSPANWIDYGDITPVKEAWEAGSIPAMTWHWNVPTVKPETIVVYEGETYMPADWSGNIQITDAESVAKLAGVGAGTVITVKTKDVGAGAQGSVKNSSWAGLSSATEYFEINGDYSVTLDATMAEAVRTGGFIISGHDYTATEIIVTVGAGGVETLDARSEVFIASNVLVEGSWENTVATADVAKLAGYLKLLQDANIPVLWRPFHEAAGDYTWGSWFWWGNSGTETTKQLWAWLRNKLENEYGLNNLIWVWTVQTSDEGKFADISKPRAAYPGDDLVDMVGTDLYQPSLSNQTEQFEMVYNTVGGKKIVALTETGNLLDVESAYVEGALWCYFMGWYDYKDSVFGFSEWNTNNEWSTVLNNPLVLNRGDFNVK